MPTSQTGGTRPESRRISSRSDLGIGATKLRSTSMAMASWTLTRACEDERSGQSLGAAGAAWLRAQT
jgi:hypothetical protein